MYFKGKRILVIGGSGTIGKKIVKAIQKEHPKLIRIFSRDEYKHYLFQNELGKCDNVRFIIGDIRDYDRVLASMQDIDYVFHLAAMKHVDICEENPYEAVRTNVHGTNNVIKAALSQNVKKVVFTSSDKAISPTNTYGATKLIGERLISAAENNKSEAQTIFASVRFGNVMGSRGSVIPLFKNKIIHDKKITVTDNNMTRFMMTMTQATELTIKALKEANGGEVFVLKMPVIHLGILVEVLIEEVCKRHQLKKEEIDIELIGLKPGEKMYEELMTYDESKIAWELPDMYVLPSNSSGLEKRKDSKRVMIGTYSSMGQEPLNNMQLRSLLKEASLI